MVPNKTRETLWFIALYVYSRILGVNIFHT